MDSLPVAIRGDIDEILEENPFPPPSGSGAVGTGGGEKINFYLLMMKN